MNETQRLRKEILAVVSRGSFKHDLARVLELTAAWSAEVAPAGEGRRMTMLGTLLGVSSLTVEECLEVMSVLEGAQVTMPPEAFSN